jgi:deoxyribodipyrimidine photo-lyase
MEDTIIFVFRRDLRIHDNTTFIETVKMANENKWKMLPIFIFNPQQIDPTKNKYFSSNCVQFMIQSLKDLNEQIKKEGGKLYYFHGTDSEIFDKLSTEVNIKAIASNKDITQFAIKRDEGVQYWCDRKGIPFVSKEDYTMYPVELVRTNQAKPFEIYTPFYRRAIRIPVPEPHSIPEITTSFTDIELENQDTDLDKYYTFNEFVEQKGGRETGLEILENMRKGGFKKYKKDKDYPIKDGTTKMSAHLKFGCLSIRETFKIAKEAYGKESQLVMSLYSREFYYNLAYNFPEILKGQLGEQKSTPLHGRYEKSTWCIDEDKLEKWKTGQTGYPIVDAAMRCLNKTGWLHNRLRMMAAMFLVRDLDIDWRVGEQYFAQKLVDYDPPSNSQGWCWVLSFRRKFNPYKQTGKYDEQCEFVKKWVPEIADVPVLDLICWWEKCINYPDLAYPLPMVAIQGYRVKFKTYIPDYVRPKDPNYVKMPKQSKYGTNKNKAKYDKNKERNKLLKQQKAGQSQDTNIPITNSSHVNIPEGVPQSIPYSSQPIQQPITNSSHVNIPQSIPRSIPYPPPPPLERQGPYMPPFNLQHAPPPPPPPPRRYMAQPQQAPQQPRHQPFNPPPPPPDRQYTSRPPYRPQVDRAPRFLSGANSIPIGQPYNQRVFYPPGPPPPLQYNPPRVHQVPVPQVPQVAPTVQLQIIKKKKNGKKRDPNRPPYVAPYQPAFTVPDTTPKSENTNN